MEVPNLIFFHQVFSTDEVDGKDLISKGVIKVMPTNLPLLYVLSEP